MKYEFAKPTPLTHTRRISLRAPLDGATVEAVRARLSAVDGVKWVAITEGEQALRLAYDAGVLNYDQVVEELEYAGARVGRGAWSRWRGAWYGFVDDNARGNASASPTCCSKPPPRDPKR